MIFDDVVKENIKGHNPNWKQIPDHPYRTLKNVKMLEQSILMILKLLLNTQII